MEKTDEERDFDVAVQALIEVMTKAARKGGDSSMTFVRAEGCEGTVGVSLYSDPSFRVHLCFWRIDPKNLDIILSWPVRQTGPMVQGNLISGYEELILAMTQKAVSRTQFTFPAKGNKAAPQRKKERCDATG